MTCVRAQHGYCTGPDWEGQCIEYEPGQNVFPEKCSGTPWDFAYAEYDDLRTEPKRREELEKFLFEQNLEAVLLVSAKKEGS